MIILRAVIVYLTITTVIITPSPLTAESRPSAHTLEKSPKTKQSKKRLLV